MSGEEEELCEYEKRRLEHIRENRNLMRALGEWKSSAVHVLGVFPFLLFSFFYFQYLIGLYAITYHSLGIEILSPRRPRAAARRKRRRCVTPSSSSSDEDTSSSEEWLPGRDEEDHVVRRGRRSKESRTL